MCWESDPYSKPMFLADHFRLKCGPQYKDIRANQNGRRLIFMEFQRRSILHMENRCYIGKFRINGDHVASNVLIRGHELR
jgi:hypothetical protein